MKRITRSSLPRLPRPSSHSYPHARAFHNKASDGSEALGTAAKLPDAEPVPPQRPHQRVTIRDILDRRAKAGRLVAGTAAYSDSDMFKAPSIGKPKAKRFDHHLSRESISREPCVLKQAARHLKQPGLISLGGGLPSAENFPLESLTVRAPTPAAGFSEAATRRAGTDLTMGKYDATGPGAEGVYDLAVALNYGQATGAAQLVRWVTEHTELVCDPPYADWQSCLTVGSTGALEQALRMLCERERGDAILTEAHSFSTALETALPLGAHIFGVPSDREGLIPQAMDEILERWDPAERRGARKPHVLYTVPSGQNPTGATQGAQRRRDIYEVARKHDLYIIEDEPYYFLQMPPYRGSSASAEIQPKEGEEQDAEAAVSSFLSSLIPPLLSIDTDGRVMRLDSFSKVVVPGARLGWITASEQMVERFLRHAEVANQGPSGISQAVLFKLLDEHWGHAGYLRWLMHLRDQYTLRRDAILGACDRFLSFSDARGGVQGERVVTWDPPVAGMFLWLKVNHTLHPAFSTKSKSKSKSILDLEADIFDRCIARGVLVSRGSWFRAEPGADAEGLFFRATFAAASEDAMAEAIKRFGSAVRESFGIEGGAE